MLNALKKIFLTIFLLTFNVNINGINPQFNHMHKQFLLPVKFWYNSAAVTHDEINDLLVNFCSENNFFIGNECYPGIILVKVNNHIIMTRPEHTDDIHILNTIPFEKTSLQSFIDTLKKDKKLEYFISRFFVKEYRFNL